MNIRWDERGLVAAVVQDFQSKEVLMLAYMNEESLRLTIETGQTWFFSRSRNSLWNKGATSGHVQDVREMHYDCDADAILVKVEQTGPACHTGKYSCFSENIELPQQNQPSANDEASSTLGTQSEYGTIYYEQHGSSRKLADSESVGEPAEKHRYHFRTNERFAIINQLEQTIAARDAERPDGAYTTYLFGKGIDKILKKIGEESAEVLIAAKNRDPLELRYEVSDLLFHLLVLLREQQVSLDEVLKELAARHAK